jgi:hypothetical protein
MPDGYKTDTPAGKDNQPDLGYDANIASIFWSLTVPADRIPQDGAQAIPNKLEFCVDQIKDWDPR